MSRNVPVEDLLVLARQCKLSEEEERRFEIAVQSSRELEGLYNAGLHFDDQAGLLSGDETSVNRLVGRALERLDQAAGVSAPRAAAPFAPPKSARPSLTSLVVRYVAASLGFGVLLCVTLASAWDYVEERAAQRAQEAQQAQQARTLTASAAARHEPRPPAPMPTAVPEPAPSVTQESPQAGTPGRLSPLPVPAGQAHQAATLDQRASSSELFARANEARRKGDIEDAISLYERLGREYPGSLEAEDAKILRGNLLLSQRSPRAALRQFEDYHSGALSLEALWGRAQALRRLANPGERDILIELIRNYPNSPYAEAAEKRLRELAR